MESHPTYSIIVETANFSTADLDDLGVALTSLSIQDPSPQTANEVIVVSSGIVELADLAKTTDRFPWISIREAPQGSSYYETKSAGIQHTTGEVVIFADADCSYHEGWLARILTAFTRQDISVVSGESALRIRNPYDLAMALVWVLPRFTNRNEMYEGSHYMANNFAMRRELLDQFPIPTLPNALRGGETAHSHELRQAGHKIWFHPQARSDHVVPAASIFFKKFLLQGNDSLVLEEMAINPVGSRHPWWIRFKNLQQRGKAILSEGRRNWFYFVIAMPIILAAITTYLCGRLIARLFPQKVERIRQGL